MRLRSDVNVGRMTWWCEKANDEENSVEQEARALEVKVELRVHVRRQLRHARVRAPVRAVEQWRMENEW